MRMLNISRRIHRRIRAVHLAALRRAVARAYRAADDLMLTVDHLRDLTARAEAALREARHRADLISDAATAEAAQWGGTL